MEQRRHGGLRGFIARPDLAVPRAFAGTAMGRSPGRDTGLTGPDAVAGCRRGIIRASQRRGSSRIPSRRTRGRGTGRPAPAVDLVDKVLLDNAATQLASRVPVTLRMLASVRIKPMPGDIYFVWRYRSIHTNEACDPDTVRATAPFHYPDPHAADRCKRKAGRAAASRGAPPGAPGPSILQPDRLGRDTGHRHDFELRHSR